MAESILTINTSINTGFNKFFMHSVRSGPGTTDGLPPYDSGMDLHFLKGTNESSNPIEVGNELTNLTKLVRGEGNLEFGHQKFVNFR